jgi:hypothetical protein
MQTILVMSLGVKNYATTLRKFSKQNSMLSKSLMTPILIIGLLACKNNKKIDSAGDKKTTVADTAANFTIGSYVGYFGDNTIALLISQIKADSVFGRSIVAGNDRPFAGTFILNDTAALISANEPGDNKYDGHFSFHILKSDQNKLAGTWKSFKPTQEATEKSFSLTRKQFVYRADVGTYPASTKLLSKADVENLSKDNLEYMRNEIFARHGYSFKKRELRSLFEMEDWYVPNAGNVLGQLTDMEQKNIALIKEYEKFAKDFDDKFAR